MRQRTFVNKDNGKLYYLLHEKGYTFGNLDDLTPLQIQYMTVCINQEVEDMEERKEEMGKETRKGKQPNIKNNDLKSKMKQKIKSKRGQQDVNSS